MNNQQFIDGSWYENEYRYGWYKLNYIDQPEPQWASETKDYYIALMVAYGGLKPDMKILDLGSGTGSAIRAWKRLGFKNIFGIEISQTAIKASGENNIVQGTIWKMPFKDKSFDILSSFALFEHIDESVVKKAISECFRVGKSQFHTVASDPGTDPSHINVKSIHEWFNYFSEMAEDNFIVCQLPDILYEINPMLVCLMDGRIPRPILDALFQPEGKNGS